MMMEQITPPQASVSEAFGDPADVGLFAEEEAVVRGAVDARRREFATVRWCARRALADLGEDAVPVLPCADGAPEWPGTLLGSLTHCSGYRAAVVGRATDFLMLGIDAEPHAPLPEDTLPLIARPAERRRLRALAAVDSAVHWDRLLFCMKEAVFKAWCPFSGQELDFGDADFTIDSQTGTFAARVLSPPYLTEGPRRDSLCGRWMVCDGLALTLIAVPVTQEAEQKGRISAAREPHIARGAA
ncbi:4'-phosphopantetheinyl transferase family protein [Streptomyces fuscigenes]|uniref:4'-phosphopantetheinyl transferase family protein n=1 Tax=Streptomyces fuscigenes TaxID=1528880 RepID=UPI001F2D8FE6|nr:4'-phosphopantetheinyl transferase superfamily protein [Streptomyces fuscigenes]MCF3960203.1 4'-phosphopantetheinyl transferase superfamily protein [Streptomyces fuscigenes]